eukprot:16223-Rhodomonas_salina.2
MAVDAIRIMAVSMSMSMLGITITAITATIIMKTTLSVSMKVMERVAGAVPGIDASRTDL